MFSVCILDFDERFEKKFKQILKNNKNLLIISNSILLDSTVVKAIELAIKISNNLGKLQNRTCRVFLRIYFFNLYICCEHSWIYYVLLFKILFVSNFVWAQTLFHEFEMWHSLSNLFFQMFLKLWISFEQLITRLHRINQLESCQNQKTPK